MPKITAHDIKIGDRIRYANGIATAKIIEMNYIICHAPHMTTVVFHLCDLKIIDGVIMTNGS